MLEQPFNGCDWGSSSGTLRTAAMAAEFGRFRAPWRRDVYMVPTPKPSRSSWCFKPRPSWIRPIRIIGPEKTVRWRGPKGPDRRSRPTTPKGPEGTHRTTEQVGSFDSGTCHSHKQRVTGEDLNCTIPRDPVVPSQVRWLETLLCSFGGSFDS